MRFRNDDKYNGKRVGSKKWGAIIVLTCILFSVFTGCEQTDSIFPQIPDEATRPSDTDVQDPTLPSDYYPEVPIITIAAPMSQETAEYLSRLYYLKTNDILGDGVSGSNISLSYLSGIEPSFVVEVLTTSGSGATSLSVESWKSTEMMPDILLTDSMSRLIGTDDLLLLNDYVASNPLFSPDNVYINMIDHLKYDADIYGIPYSASADVVFVNTEWIEHIQDESLPFELSTDLLTDLSFRIITMNVEEELEEPILPFFSVTAMIPNMLDIQAMMSELGDDDTALSDLDDEALVFLRTFASEYYSTDLMTEEEKDEWFGETDPILSNRVAMWAGRSDDVTRWATNFPYSVSMVQTPSFETGQMSNPHLTIYPLCISSSTAHPELASDFAAFIALDEDAVMLRMRLEVLEGYIPVLKAKRVWDASFAHVTYSSSLHAFREYVDQATFSNRVTDHVLDERIREAMQEYGALMVNPDEDLDASLELFIDYLMTG